MKIRNGFVSNSSSSSFVLVTTKENHERALQAFHPAFRKVLDSIVEKRMFMGREIVTYFEMDVHGSGTIEYLEHEPMPEKPMSPIEALASELGGEPLTQKEIDRYGGSVGDLLYYYQKEVEKLPGDDVFIAKADM